MIDLATFLKIDFPALATAILACFACGVAGNFLVLRRQALMGDAISHAILPGIVGAFVLSESRAFLPVMAGALTAAVAAALLIETVRRLGRIESGAAMGMVFTVFFAAGVIVMEQAAAHAVDLDPDCLLYGQLEDVLWLRAEGWGSFTDPAALADLPRELVTLAAVSAVVVALLQVFWKELKLTTFDPDLATALGFRAGWFHYGLITVVALVAIASFEAVGSILVIATLICPAAIARLLTDRYRTQVALSGLVGVAAAIGGYALAAWVPMWLGLGWTLNVAGMIAVVLGLMLVAAATLGPIHGLSGRIMRRAAARAAARDMAPSPL